jgi:hypothetical protein
VPFGLNRRGLRANSLLTFRKLLTDDQRQAERKVESFSEAQDTGTEGPFFGSIGETESHLWNTGKRVQQSSRAWRNSLTYKPCVRAKVMDYVKGILSGSAAILIAEFVFFWPTLRATKATGLAAGIGLLVGSILSPRFWIIGVLLFGLFFAASRLGNKGLRVFLFWIPTLAVSCFTIAVVALIAYVLVRFRHS